VEGVSNKEIMIVEAGYPYAWEVPGTTIDYTSTYAYSEDGQRQFTADLIETLNNHAQVTGLFWWWMEYNAYGAGLSGWYNAPLFDSRSGKALSALSELKNFLNDNNAIENISANVIDADPYWYNINGTRTNDHTLPGTYIHAEKIIIQR
jgi:arabinogalactan endo-1,4-beta-galactosidase